MKPGKYYGRTVDYMENIYWSEHIRPKWCKEKVKA